ncbi:putative eukaryotic translation initiation factor eIF1a-like protein, partial [Aureobasidium melanogenum]
MAKIPRRQVFYRLYPSYLSWLAKQAMPIKQPPVNINLADRQVAIMPKPRRNLQATAEETMTPPASLTETQSVARVQQAAGNNLYRVELPDTKVLLVELPARFRSAIWIKRGGFVLVDTGAMNERENKLDGEIINIVRNEKEWRKEKYWPKEFVQRISYADEDDSDEEESNVGKMPPSDSEDDAGKDVPSVLLRSPQGILEDWVHADRIGRENSRQDKSWCHSRRDLLQPAGRGKQDKNVSSPTKRQFTVHLKKNCLVNSNARER